MAGAGCGTTAYSDIVKADHPIGYWPLDETSGVTFADATGNGYTATQSGASSVTIGQACGSGSGKSALLAPLMISTPSGGEVSKIYNSALDNLSVEVVVKITAGKTGWMILFERDVWNDQSGFGLAINYQKTNVTFGRYNSPNLVTGPTMIGDGAYHHVVGTITKVAAGNYTYSVYVDGTLDTQLMNAANGVSAVTSPPAMAGTGQFVIGHQITNQGGGNAPLSANLAQVAFYDYALSPAQVRQHAQAR
jgi:hypothetical protein